MLTQCPECKTTFRLHLNQLKAAAGKVRCSRCHTTFDALDNLVEAPLPVEEPFQSPPPEECPPPAPESTESSTATGETEVSSSKPEIETRSDAAHQDTLSAFIDELEESTANCDEAPLSLVGASTASAVTEDKHTEYSAEAIDETVSQEPGQLPPPDDTASLHTDLITTALDFLDDMPRMEPAAEAALPVVEAAVPDETVEEFFTVEPVADEPAELEAAPDETVEEFFTVEPVADEPAELEAAPDETVEEFFTVEPVADEPAELEAAPDEAVEEYFAVEPVADEPAELEAAPDEAVEEYFAVEPVADEPAELEAAPDEAVEEYFAVEPEAAAPGELETAPDDSIEEFFTVEPIADEPAELDVAPDEAVEEFAGNVDEHAAEETAEITMTAAEPLISDEELDSLFDESDPVTETAVTESLIETATMESESQSAISADELDAFFDEPVTASPGEAPVAEPEQVELLSLFDEEPANGLAEGADEGAALDAVTLPEEPPAPRPPSDPLIPFSEEQLESMLSPSEEQVAEEAAVSKVSLYAPEELDLDTGEEGPETLSVQEEERPLEESPTILTDYTVPTEYAIPAELAPDTAREGSGMATMLWGLGILLMCATLVLQYLYYHRLQLVENPQLRPVLATLCDLTGCQLPPQRDLGRIELTEHLVQFHPNYEQSLLISATLANRADFAQPYPLVEVMMTDIEQRIVAHRRFTPAQYLPNQQGGGSFPANSEVPLLLEVLDPGNEAVGFEFRFY